jgi:hypothetical protein
MKIIEGCMAIVINGLVASNIGKITKVSKFLGKCQYDDNTEHDTWEVELPMTCYDGSVDHHQIESNLQRLPDIDDQEQTTTKIDETITA